jgi:hypothetical protein
VIVERAPVVVERAPVVVERAPVVVLPNRDAVGVPPMAETVVVHEVKT